MTISLKHNFVSLKSDGTDPTQVQPSSWNAEHVIRLAGGNLIGRMTAGTGPAEEIELSEFMAGALSAANAEEFLAKLGIGGFVTGDVKPSFSDVAGSGWIVASAGSIGNATSTATILANESARALFIKLWNGTTNAVCPVTGGRGGGAALDFDAGKRLTIPDLVGRSLIGVGKSSATGGITWTNAFASGENVHTLTVDELANHAHANYLTDPTHVHYGVAVSSVPTTTPGGAFTIIGSLVYGASSSAFTGVVLTNVSVGGNAAHNTVHPSTGVYYHIKL